MQEFLVAINHAEFITIDLCRADPKRPVYLTRIDPYVVGWCAPATRDRLLNYKEWIGGAEVRECTEFDPGEFGFRWPSSKGSRAKELPRKLRDSWSAKLKRLNPGKGLLQLKLSNPTRACYITIWGPEDGSTLDFWTHVCQALGCDVEIGRRVEAFLEAELEERERAVAVFEGGKSSSSTFGDGKRG